ncbi:MAG: C4-dicarboxylate transporter DcuC, partial [Tannerellaceae bacterium]|nr:C4-dicarboxylate transporter DcuC [Tannerellaceae bacterium]
SVISAATLFDQGPGSANTALAAELTGQTNVAYFITRQLPLVIPATLVVMVLFYFNNRYFDKKEAAGQHAEKSEKAEVSQTSVKPDIPLIFALLPILPLALLIVFSPYTGLFEPPVTLNTTTAMIFSFFISLLFVGCHTRNMRRTFDAFSGFWKGMGNVFGSVITLIVASEIFSKGLISLGFIDSLVNYSTHIGLSGIVIAAVFALIIFCTAMLMGSGNAAFFSFGPLLPGIAGQLGMPAYSLVLPLQLAASMGRAASPIAGIIVAIAGVAGVSPIELAKRNTLPLTGCILFLIAYHFITL